MMKKYEKWELVRIVIRAAMIALLVGLYAAGGLGLIELVHAIVGIIFLVLVWMAIEVHIKRILSKLLREEYPKGGDR